MTGNKYINKYVNFLSKQAAVKKPLKAVLDCSNGPAGLVLKKLRMPNAEFHILNSRIDGRFPAHGPNPLERGALKDIKRVIKKSGADIGIIFDADADRAIFVDNLGRLMPFYAVAFLISGESRPPYVGDLYIAKIMECLELRKFKPSMVGTKNMKETIKKSGASFGAELSGHYFFSEIKNADSGILAAIKALNALSKTPCTAAQIVKLLPDFYYKQFNKRTENPEKLAKKILGVYRPMAKKIGRLDGYLFDFGNWFLVVRSSNTEPLFRFFLGSRNKAIFQKELKKLKSFL